MATSNEEVAIEVSEGEVAVRADKPIIHLTIRFPDAMCSIALQSDQAERVANLLHHDAEAVSR